MCLLLIYSGMQISLMIELATFAFCKKKKQEFPWMCIVPLCPIYPNSVQPSTQRVLICDGSGGFVVVSHRNGVSARLTTLSHALCKLLTQKNVPAAATSADGPARCASSRHLLPVTEPTSPPASRLRSDIWLSWKDWAGGNHAAFFSAEASAACF